MKFYTNNNIRIKEIKEFSHKKVEERFGNDDLIILMEGYSEREIAENLGFDIEYRSIPLWVEEMNRFFKVYPAYKTLLLYSKKQ